MIDHVVEHQVRRQRRWHFLLTRDLEMMMRQISTGRHRWRWSSLFFRRPGFVRKIRQRRLQRLQFLEGWYVLGGQINEYVAAIEETARPSGPRTDAGDAAMVKMDALKYCWMHDQRRYFQIEENSIDYCDECHSRLSTAYCSWCSICQALRCYDCRWCQCRYTAAARHEYAYQSESESDY